MLKICGNVPPIEKDLKCEETLPKNHDTEKHRIVLWWQRLADFKQTVTGRRPCKQKCNKCGQRWEKTKTNYVNLIMPKQQPFDHLYWCDGCTVAEINSKNDS